LVEFSGSIKIITLHEPGKLIKMEIFAETERLLLREILPTDEEGLFQLDSDPEVHRYLGNKPIRDKEQTKEVIQFIRQQYVDNGIGRWAIVDKVTNDFIGWAGLKFVNKLTNNHVNYYDLGYRLRKNYWGQGIATESAKAIVTYGFEKLKVKEMFAMADVENLKSNHILTKIGFKLVEAFVFDGIKHYWYKMDKIEWLKKSNP